MVRHTQGGGAVRAPTRERWHAGRSGGAGGGAAGGGVSGGAYQNLMVRNWASELEAISQPQTCKGAGGSSRGGSGRRA